MRLNPRPAVARRPGTRTSRHVRAGRARERCWRRRDAMRYSAIRVRMRSLTPLFVAGLSFAYLLTFPLAIGGADESHLLYGAKRILDGEVIYRDFFEIITPLAFYLFAAIYRIAGTTLAAARVGMAILDAAGCALLFHLARRISGLAEATLATLIFACVCLPTWPYASAHWISTVLGLLVATVTLACTGGWASRVRPLAAGIVAGIAVCVQQQRGVFLAAWLPLALWLLSRPLARGTRWRTLGAQIAWGASGGAVGPGRGARARGLDIVARCRLRCALPVQHDHVPRGPDRPPLGSRPPVHGGLPCIDLDLAAARVAALPRGRRIAAPARVADARSPRARARLPVAAGGPDVALGLVPARLHPRLLRAAVPPPAGRQPAARAADRAGVGSRCPRAAGS